VVKIDYSTFAFPKGGLVKEKKKRATVSQETYDKVFKICKGKCAICGTTTDIHYHHILYRSERKDLIDEPSNGIMLCEDFANKCHRKVHANKKLWQPKLLKLRKQLEKENKKK
jgi:5-methylcytosine-specific restriction endonuclease McrA